MTSEHATEAYVWMWLPQALSPIVVGKMALSGQQYHFTYGQRYRTRLDAMPLSPVELPLTARTFSPTGLHDMPACLRDASPDAWGRRLIDYQMPQLNPNELDYLLLSGSDRIGALDFQASATEYVPRDAEAVELEVIDSFATMLEQQRPISKKLLPILLHGTSVGGARPKCLLEKEGKPYIAKFSLSSDHHALVKTEYIAMRLAAKVGLDVAPVLLTKSAGRDILLVERFDRVITQEGVHRKHMLSVLSLLGLHEMEARYASYLNLAHLIRQRFDHPRQLLRELFGRLVFNILIGNNDDHARNHAAFWDGQCLRLTPAYDLSPQLRMGYESTQAMRIAGVQGNASTLVNVLSVCAAFLLQTEEARQLIVQQIEILEQQWPEICGEARLSQQEQCRLWGSVIKSDYCLQGFKH